MQQSILFWVLGFSAAFASRATAFASLSVVHRAQLHHSDGQLHPTASTGEGPQPFLVPPEQRKQVNTTHELQLDPKKEMYNKNRGRRICSWQCTGPTRPNAVRSCRSESRTVFHRKPGTLPLSVTSPLPAQRRGVERDRFSPLCTRRQKPDEGVLSGRFSRGVGSTKDQGIGVRMRSPRGGLGKQSISVPG